MDDSAVVAIWIGVPTVVVAIYAAVIGTLAWLATRRSAKATEDGVPIAKSMRTLTAESVRLQTQQIDDADRPVFEPILPTAPTEMTVDGVVVARRWDVSLELAERATVIRVTWAVDSKIKGPEESLPTGGTVTPISWTVGGKQGPVDLHSGQRFGFVVDERGPFGVSEIESDIAIWCEEIDPGSGKPTERTWGPLMRSLRYGPDVA